MFRLDVKNDVSELLSGTHAFDLIFYDVKTCMHFLTSIDFEQSHNFVRKTK